MVQNVGGQYYGSINAVGMTQNGRVIYQVINSEGQEAGKITIKREDCPKFENSYRTLLRTAPLMQEYARTATPEKVEKMQKKAKWLTIGGTLLGGGIPLFLLKGPKNAKPWIKALVQIAATLAGTIAGFIGGTAAASKFATPKGSMEFMKATQEMQKIDIQPYGQQVNTRA